jgi:hypothetical protein
MHAARFNGGIAACGLMQFHYEFSENYSPSGFYGVTNVTYFF